MSMFMRNGFCGLHCNGLLVVGRGKVYMECVNYRRQTQAYFRNSYASMKKFKDKVINVWLIAVSTNDHDKTWRDYLPMCIHTKHEEYFTIKNEYESIQRFSIVFAYGNELILPPKSEYKQDIHYTLWHCTKRLVFPSWNLAKTQQRGWLSWFS